MRARLLCTTLVALCLGTPDLSAQPEPVIGISQSGPGLPFSFTIAEPESRPLLLITYISVATDAEPTDVQNNAIAAYSSLAEAAVPHNVWDDTFGQNGAQLADLEPAGAGMTYPVATHIVQKALDSFANAIDTNGTNGFSWAKTNRCESPGTGTSYTWQGLPGPEFVPGVPWSALATAPGSGTFVAEDLVRELLAHQFNTDPDYAFSNVNTQSEEVSHIINQIINDGLACDMNTVALLVSQDPVTMPNGKKRPKIKIRRSTTRLRIILTIDPGLFFRRFHPTSTAQPFVYAALPNTAITFAANSNLIEGETYEVDFSDGVGGWITAPVTDFSGNRLSVMVPAGAANGRVNVWRRVVVPGVQRVSVSMQTAYQSSPESYVNFWNTVNPQF